MGEALRRLARLRLVFTAAVPLIHHVSRRGDTAVVIIKHQRDDQWLIYRDHIEKDFIKCLATQDQIKRLLTRGNDGSHE